MSFLSVPCCHSHVDDECLDAYERAREELDEAGHEGRQGSSKAGESDRGEQPRGIKKALAEVDAQLKRDWNQHVTLTQVGIDCLGGIFVCFVRCG